jgi:hypothetical protein
VRQPIASHDRGDSLGLELTGNAVTGRSIEMGALQQRGQLTGGMSGQQHEHSRAVALGGNPVAHHLPRRACVRRQDREPRAQSAIEHGDGCLVRIQQSEACMLGVGVNLSGQQGKVMPAIYRRKRYE